MAAEDPSHSCDRCDGVEISNRDRVIFPDSGQTKGALADYYAMIAPAMLPFAAQRPISLVRCPQGRQNKCFFQRHAASGFGDAVKRMPIREKSGEIDDYIFVEDSRGLLQCAQMGTIEFHGWGSRCIDVEAPDRMVFDLDPDEGLEFGCVVAAARDVRNRLADLGLASFAMLTGGKGMHVVVPLTPRHDWEAHKQFAKRIAVDLRAENPGRFTATMGKRQRTGRIFIDWLRNQRGSTAVLPYSARARKGAPVAAPVDWDELDVIDRSGNFTINDGSLLFNRRNGGPLSRWGKARQNLPIAR